ncbi:MAG: ABC transporter ATP-binding protein [Alphaproteobacteria bacterium]|nr:ABC transporter ATP-binding protein [Alphaproteobacteria bacterium]
MLRVADIRVSYGQAIAVAGTGLHVPQGGWVALLGANGAGKTSLARAIVGLVRHQGRTTLAGEDISALPAWERQRRGIGYVPEGRQVFPRMTVEENLRVGAYTCPDAEVRRGLDMAFALFPRLAERRAQLAATLSGGEQQMLALARALMTQPKLLLVDEISWGLMPILVTQVFARLEELHRGGLTILQIEQNAREVLRRAQHAYVMAAGRIVLEGPAADLARDSRVVESYIG